MQEGEHFILPNSPTASPESSRREREEKWTREECLHLIGLYEQNPVLWDKNHPHYSLNRSVLKAGAWNEISSKMNMSVAEVRHKMDTLLASFRREKALVVKKMRHGSTNCTSGWYGFKAFSFLLFKVTKKKKAVVQPKPLHLSRPSVAETYLIKKDNPNVIVMKQPSRKPTTVVTNEISSFTNFLASKMTKYSDTTNNAVQREICKIIFKADQQFYEKGTCDTTSSVDDYSIPSTSREQVSPAKSDHSFVVKDEFTTDDDD